MVAAWRQPLSNYKLATRSDVSHAVAKFFTRRVCVTFLGLLEFLCNTVLKDRLKEAAAMPKRSIRSAISIQYRLVTDADTDTQRVIAILR